jgi:tetratricopeptide (TPR) repeat protein
MPEQLLQRAALLLQQKKFKDAEAILGGLFAKDPSNPLTVRLLCEVKLGQDKFDEALQLADNAIALDPSDGDGFYLRSRVNLHLDKYDDSEGDLEQAIALDPYDANYFSLLSMVKLDRKQYAEALELADKALEVDPENIHALNARSTALIKLNRKIESFNTIEGALRHDPSSAFTHANYGWGLLEKGSHKKALYHFSEALRENPNLEIARAGMAEALKARYAGYRLFLKYSFWIGNLQQKSQWAVIVGMYLSIRLLRAVANSNPSLQPFILPVVILLALFAFTTWIVTPVSNLFLRLNKYGKHLLDKKQIMSSTLVGLCVLMAVVGLLMYFISSRSVFISMAIFGLTMMIPLGVAFTEAKNRYVLPGYTILLVLLGTAGIISSYLVDEALNPYMISYLIGVFIFQWVANYVVIRESNK